MRLRGRHGGRPLHEHALTSPLEGAADRPLTIQREWERIDAAFEAARERLGARVPCRRGCSACCAQAAVFDVHAADARLLGAWLAAAPEPERADVLRRARDVVASVQRAARRLARTDPSMRGWHWREGLGTLTPAAATRLADEAAGPCPLLDPGGECRAHAFRPALCRLQGLPWEDPLTGATLPDFCRLEPGQEFLEAQPMDLLLLDEFRESARAALPATMGRTFVAAALLLVEGRPPPFS